MMVKYVVIPGNGEDEEDEEEDRWYESEYATVYRINADGSRTEVGWIGGEPEDNTYYRDYGWVEGALNEAYQLGLKDGARREYDRLQDKV